VVGAEDKRHRIEKEYGRLLLVWHGMSLTAVAEPLLLTRCRGRLEHPQDAEIPIAVGGMKACRT